MDTPTWKTPIAEDCFMVGRRDPGSILQCNTYLRTFRGKGSPMHWCVDPGSRLDYPDVRRHLLHHVGEMKAVRMFSINHQDPDVVGNVPEIVKENPRITGLTTEDTWRLVRHLNAQPKRLIFTNRVPHYTVPLVKGQELRVVPTPFCHFRGAVALYDPESRVLFSGDLFGGLNAPGRVHLYAEEEDWPGIAQFHQIYMPTLTALTHAIRQIRALKPAVEVIAPQHGFVLKGDFMHEVMDLLEELHVGLDLLPLEEEKRQMRAYQGVLDEVLALGRGYLGRDVMIAAFRNLPNDHPLHRYLKITGKDIVLRESPMRALPLVIDVLSRGEFEEVRNDYITCALNGCTRRKLPVPNIGVGLDKGDYASEGK
jgi:glyoxylase-like metal-dependent hydrolase (beta-lactamase superfamily II)